MYAAVETAARAGPVLDHDGLSVHRDVQPTVRHPEKHEGWHE
ncbi:MAG TPA: hypothetical protein VNT12_07345 [Rubrobacter sp.]|nr:hypothetical protein [Rubrobacter sp.]